jgi:hypothetical protein
MTTIDPAFVGNLADEEHDRPRNAGKLLPPPYGPLAMGHRRVPGRWAHDGGAVRRPAIAALRRAAAVHVLPGNYTFDGTTLSTRVDASSDADRIGGDQTRTVRFENGLMVLGAASGGSTAASLQAPGARLGGGSRTERGRRTLGTTAPYGVRWNFVNIRLLTTIPSFWERRMLLRNVATTVETAVEAREAFSTARCSPFSS